MKRYNVSRLVIKDELKKFYRDKKEHEVRLTQKVFLDTIIYEIITGVEEENEDYKDLTLDAITIKFLNLLKEKEPDTVLCNDSINSLVKKYVISDFEKAYSSL